MDLGVVQEMCETTLLYLGNNLYAMLRRCLFILERPIPFDLEDMQMMRPLHQDLTERHMYFEMRIGSYYETLVHSDEVTPIPDIKPFQEEGSPTTHKSIFDMDYTLPDIAIKQEPGLQASTLHTVIGHIIHQPDAFAKSIKQEIIDNTVRDITDKHSATCSLNVFIQEHGGASSLRIDVRSLILDTPTSGIMLHPTCKLQTARRAKHVPMQQATIRSSKTTRLKAASSTSLSMVTKLS